VDELLICAAIALAVYLGIGVLLVVSARATLGSVPWTFFKTIQTFAVFIVFWPFVVLHLLAEEESDG
jgi:hypothetical protein